MTATETLRGSVAWGNLPWQKYAPDTVRLYEWILGKFFDFAGMDPDAFVAKAVDRKWAEQTMISFAKKHMDRKLAGGSVVLFLAPVKKFCKMNDVDVNWDRVGAHMPKQRKYASDRPPTMDEVRILLQDADLRLKAAILFMVASGIRIGAWDYLKVKDVEPVTDEEGKVLCARVKVYAGEEEGYVTYLTPEAWAALKAYLDFRSMNGEAIGPDSPLMAQRFKTKRGNPTTILPLRLSSRGARMLLEGALRSHKIRTDFRRRHEFKVAHGYRKLFKTRAQVTMKPILVEMLMGHDVGLEASYYKPSEREIMEDYLKAVPLLTVSREFQQEKEIRGLAATIEEQTQLLSEERERFEREKSSWESKFQELHSQVQDIVREREAELAAKKSAG